MPAAENENQRHLLYGVTWFQERRLGRDEFTCVNRDAAGIYISMPRRTRKRSSMGRRGRCAAVAWRICNQGSQVKIRM